MALDWSNVRMSISGIRGIVPDDFTAGHAYAAVRAYAEKLPYGSIVLSHDGRGNHPSLLRALRTALADSGRMVFDAGMIPLPTTQIITHTLDAIAGIELTASHNPSHYNGLKFLTSEGEFIGEEMLAEIQSIFGEYEYDGEERLPESVDVRDQAIEAHLERLRPKYTTGRRLRVAVDAVNASGSVIVPKLLREMDCEVVPLAVDGTGVFPHNPEPREENLRWTLRELDEQDIDLCIVVDPDADRLILIDENHTIVSEEHLIPLIAKERVMRGDTGTIVVNLSTSRMVEDVVTGSGISVVRSKVGERNVVEMMKQTSAILGGEGAGSLIDPSVHYGRDSLVGIVSVINLIRGSNKKLSELVAEIPAYTFLKDKVTIGGAGDIRALYAKILESFEYNEHDERDGLKIVHDTYWLHVRPSNTEPILRIYCEAADATTAQDVVARAKALIC